MKRLLQVTAVMIGLAVLCGMMVPTATFAAQEIKIGVIYPLTGGAAAAGRELRAGAELAAPALQRGPQRHRHDHGQDPPASRAWAGPRSP